MKNIQMFETLIAKGPVPENKDEMMLYGQFVGDWEGTCIFYESGQVKHKTPMEVHFDWILEGRAIQDVWIAPSRKERMNSDYLKNVNFYGTSIRIYNPHEDIWNIYWFKPESQDFMTMAGKKEGQNIVQTYSIGDDLIGQWIYTDIKKESLHWIAQESTDSGTTWELEQEFFLNRCSG